MSDISFRLVEEADRDWIKQLARDRWGSDLMVVHGSSYWISSLPGYLAEKDGERRGLVTYRIEGQGCEIMSLNSLLEGAGIGAGLIEAVKRVAQSAGCRRLYLTTTNDNLHALRFYQRRGFILAALRCGAVMESRRIKPEIPLTGEHSIPIRDEIELEMWLDE